MTAIRTAVVADPLGLHARPAAELVAQARAYESDLVLASGEKTGNCKSLLAVLKLGIVGGTEVTVTAMGPDEAVAVEVLASFLELVHGEGTS
jgi:phosphotransferase system HPr (HPr) family protein